MRAPSMQADDPQTLHGCRCRWTDEFCDRHSCVSLVRGGSNYAHSPAGYYFPRPSSLATHNTWLMLSESMDR